MEKIFLDRKNIKKLSKNLTLILGTFDGVHVGHQKLFLEAQKIAESKTGVLVVDLNEKNYLSSIQDRFTKIRKYNLDYFLIFELNKENRNLSCEEFENILKKLGCKNIVVGNDFSYGKKAVGNVLNLKEKFNVQIVDFVNYKNKKISSSFIKDIVRKGDIELAKKLLGRPYQIKGEVKKGFGKGTDIGFPTLNVVPEKNYVLPKNGVYKTLIYVLGVPYISITNVGVHPTINKLKEPICETHIIGFNEKIFCKYAYIEFLEFLREEKKFDSIELLKKQIQKDIKKI